MTSPSLFPLQFKSKRILCIGDVMVDRYVYGDVTRISPEAPVPVLTHTTETNMLGGAGNAARNLAALGAHVDFMTVIGDDSAGHLTTDLLMKEMDANKKFAARTLLTEKGRITPMKTRYCSGSQQMLRVDCERDDAVINHSLERRLCAHISSAILECDAVLISDYDKGMMTKEVIEAIKSNCAFYNRPLIIDPKKRPFSLYEGATLITPNQSEWDYFGISYADAAPMNVLVTKGDKGMELCTHKAIMPLKSLAKNVYDVSGAGDTVAAVMTLMLACNAEITDAAYIANIAAGIAVGKRGTTPVTFAELIDYVHPSYRAKGC